eukprot:CAMPEP_0202699810 /NCGR_PEP_ID=MMETSP1385-20130828/13026_1 /ASSEMBLY_ACC=CAM_ASM_000861 /TAXON_ID=933848 /ORGANISM="Elphidium margaritaceum" /LENGTH=181 /DNA_ID=CAMNT_0049356835 /DNA_START=56 /DNA_END=601 /DNA_ORIENTATION=+
MANAHLGDPIRIDGRQRIKMTRSQWQQSMSRFEANRRCNRTMNNANRDLYRNSIYSDSNSLHDENGNNCKHIEFDRERKENEVRDRVNAGSGKKESKAHTYIGRFMDSKGRIRLSKGQLQKLKNVYGTKTQLLQLVKNVMRRPTRDCDVIGEGQNGCRLERASRVPGERPKLFDCCLNDRQ